MRRVRVHDPGTARPARLGLPRARTSSERPHGPRAPRHGRRSLVGRAGPPDVPFARPPRVQSTEASPIVEIGDAFLLFIGHAGYAVTERRRTRPRRRSAGLFRSARPMATNPRSRRLAGHGPAGESLYPPRVRSPSITLSDTTSREVRTSGSSSGRSGRGVAIRSQGGRIDRQPPPAKRAISAAPRAIRRMLRPSEVRVTPSRRLVPDRRSVNPKRPRAASAG
jgi:hypothetical protein